jgi:hypothetical protein
MPRPTSHNTNPPPPPGCLTHHQVPHYHGLSHGAMSLVVATTSVSWQSLAPHRRLAITTGEAPAKVYCTLPSRWRIPLPTSSPAKKTCAGSFSRKHAPGGLALQYILQSPRLSPRCVRARYWPPTGRPDSPTAQQHPRRLFVWRASRARWRHSHPESLFRYECLTRASPPLFIVQSPRSCRSLPTGK